MGKDFLKLKADRKKVSIFVFFTGMALTVGMGMKAVQNTELEKDYKLQRGEDSYEQELIAQVKEQKIPVTVTVDERTLSEEEAEEELTLAAEYLDEILRAENVSLSKVTGNLEFVDWVEGTSVEVTWTDKLPEYFYSDGTFREDTEIAEPVEQKISAILSCQEYTKDYEAVITLLPRRMSSQTALIRLIEEENESSRGNNIMMLPKEYEDSEIVWKKPLDYTFLYFPVLTVAAIVFLKAGEEHDLQAERKARLEALEKDYAQIVSKFAMLLAAGLSLRNAWERIIRLYREDKKSERIVYAEMKWALKEMQKGAPELEVYERFGSRIGQIHYKKLMALFVSYKRRGSINLLEVMEQEMLQAWEEQKRKTRQQGEKIGTKLLVPMMGMLTVVFIMVIVPAFLSFQI